RCGLAPLLARLLLESKPFQNKGPAPVIGPRLQAELAGAVQDSERFLIVLSARVTRRGLLRPHAGQHQEQGITVSGDFVLPMVGKASVRGSCSGIYVDACESQRRTGCRLGRLQIGGRLRTEENGSFLGADQPVDERLVPPLDKLLVVL